MSNKSLTVIVGAGASREVGLPTGAELKSTISSRLNFQFEHGVAKKGGDYEIYEAVKQRVRNSGGTDNNPYWRAAWRIRDAMPQAISIDNFIDTHQGDEKIELCGKLAIAKSILDAEKRSTLYVNPYKGKSQINFASTEEAWLNPFFRLITENCRSADLAGRLSKVSVVCFNYDRCIEHYLHGALQNYYGIPANSASELINSMDIYHPYGTVGRLPWQPGSDRVEYGADANSHQLLEIAGQIKTFTEGTDPDSSEIEEIRASTRESIRLLFLGFAFHRLNMQLLRSTENLPATNPEKRIFATALGISQIDANEIADDLRSLGNCDPKHIHVRNDLSSHAAFSEFSRGLSLQ